MRNLLFAADSVPAGTIVWRIQRVTDLNINLNVPALEKLMDYTASGVGAIAGLLLAPLRASREGKARLTAAKADAEVRRIEAESDAQSLVIIADAQAKARQSFDTPIESERGMMEISRDNITQKIEFQERKRLANVRSVVTYAAEELQDKEVQDHAPDPDWTARLFDSVQDVSSEEMQRIWAKILSGEVESPGRTSLRTLDTLRNMTKRDAEMFRDVCDFVIRDVGHDFVFYDGKYPHSYDALRYDNLFHLQDCGLMNVGPLLINRFTWNDRSRREGIVFSYQDGFLKVMNEKGTEKELKIPSVFLTTAGRELSRIAECTLQSDYLRSFAGFLRSKKCQLSYATVIKESPGEQFRHADFTLIEPSS